jgi:hypothetical protein
MNDRQRANYDLDELLHPAQAFSHPSEVVKDLDLTQRKASHSIIVGFRRVRGRGRARSSRYHFGPRRPLGCHHGCPSRTRS